MYIPGAYRGQKVSDLLILELQMVVSHNVGAGNLGPLQSTECFVLSSLQLPTPMTSLMQISETEDHLFLQSCHHRRSFLCFFHWSKSSDKDSRSEERRGGKEGM